jgi:deferrochelatase/peroxidase EfeB
MTGGRISAAKEKKKKEKRLAKRQESRTSGIPEKCLSPEDSMDRATPPNNPPPTDPGLAAQHCLTLSIPLKPAAHEALRRSGDVKRIAEAFGGGTQPKGPTASSALNISPGGGLVHFADAVLMADNRILVVAIYDGEWDPYIDAFLNNAGLVWALNTIVLPSAASTPEAPVPQTPVEEHWDDFKTWLKRIDANVKGHDPKYQPSAISHGPTATEIRNMLPGLPGTSNGSGEGFTGSPPSPPVPPQPAPPIPRAKVDLSDVQGLILRGYNMPSARHYFLAVTDKVKAREVLGKLARGAVEAPLPKVTTAAPWGMKPPACLNVGLTASGLAALGLDQAILTAFPAAFRRGARDPETLATVGDVGLSDISKWDEPYKSTEFHVVVMVQAVDPATRGLVDAALRNFIQGAFKIVGTDDADDLPESRIHFGYVDGIAQPQLAIDGLPFTPDGEQGLVAAGAFLWGQPRNQAKPFPLPPWTSQQAQSNPFLNSSFCAFRKLSQDVAAFEKFLDDAAQDAWRRKVPGFTGVRGDDKERVAAKLCGRWRSGVPLELSPNSPDYDAMPARYAAQSAAARKAVHAAKPPKQLDDFDYGEDYFAKTGSNAHILRANPRFAPEGADIASAHRVMRRAIPYGPQYKPGEPVTADRGLIGPFIGLDLADQFEFIMGAWFLTGAAFTAPNPEPFLGPAGDFSLQFPTGKPATPRVTCPVYQPDPTKKGRHPQLIATKGSAYLFLPSVGALKHLAALAG